ncbi:MAG: indolepyruvate ferredoxin oxidoreductase subunit alpha, partial [bacterium]
MSTSLTHEVLQVGPGNTACLLGNLAIVRGALEAGVQFFSCYPGTPASEVGDTFARIAKDAKILFEYSINEKIALEIAFAASLTGARAMCGMKHLGLSYAGDPLSTMPYLGVKGGLVILAAGDPSAITSP